MQYPAFSVDSWHKLGCRYSGLKAPVCQWLESASGKLQFSYKVKHSETHKEIQEMMNWNRILNIENRLGKIRDLKKKFAYQFEIDLEKN